MKIILKSLAALIALLLAACVNTETLTPILKPDGTQAIGADGKPLYAKTTTKASDSQAVNAYGGLGLELAKLGLTYEVDRNSGK